MSERWRWRALLLGAALLWAPSLLVAHTPFGQWVSFREERLHIGTSREDPRGFAHGEALVASLAVNYPESRALVSRAFDTKRLASLLGSQQFAVAVLSEDALQEALAGQGDFAEVGPQPLRQICATGAHLLLAHSALSPHITFRMAAALTPQGDCSPNQAAPLHAGVQAFLQGEDEPAPPVSTHEEGHSHADETDAIDAHYLR
jgi:hypothetical protein